MNIIVKCYRVVTSRGFIV